MFKLPTLKLIKLLAYVPELETVIEKGILMKKNSLVLVFMLIASISFAEIIKQENGNVIEGTIVEKTDLDNCETSKDCQIRKLLIGDWKEQSDPVLITYKVDGSFYQEIDLFLKKYIITGKWRVANGYLFYEECLSSDNTEFPVEASTSDEIISIDENEYQYKSGNTGKVSTFKRRLSK